MIHLEGGGSGRVIIYCCILLCFEVEIIHNKESIVCLSLSIHRYFPHPPYQPVSLDKDEIIFKTHTYTYPTEQ